MSIELVRVSKQARDQLITLKRRTGIENWNVICRWAFCVSIVEPTRPRNQKIVTDSPIEMTWRTFAGEYDEVYRSLLLERCHREGLEPTPVNLATILKLHLHRGISYLAGDPAVSDIHGLVNKALGSPPTK